MDLNVVKGLFFEIPISSLIVRRYWLLRSPSGSWLHTGDKPYETLKDLRMVLFAFDGLIKSNLYLTNPAFYCIRAGLARSFSHEVVSICLSLLHVPVSLMKIEFKVTDKKWRHYFLHFKSIGKKFRAQERITPKWIIWSCPNSNSFELLCLSSSPASLTKIQ